MTRMADLRHGRLLRFLALCAAGYLLVAALTDSPFLILMLNGLVASATAGVCVAYSPVLVAALPARAPTKGDYLGSGIFLVALSMLAQRLVSFIGRDGGWPDIFNSDWETAIMTVGLVGVLLHLWAPNAVEGRVPRARWVSTGFIVAAGFFVTFMVWNASVGSGAHPMVELR